ncbi:unnamed protein product [Arabis nemorensis]|uniref:Uncharacterized protein n=1 Tax=Arabis nemorensis TaxID=586526 RepID=A0A565CBS3_9BRAS|nr:unnamed protein product [Arabis nemorensis]
MALIYEYMANGNLGDYLSGKSSLFLSWEERLKISIDAAQDFGLSRSFPVEGNGQVSTVVAGTIGGRFEAGSAWKITEIALACASESSARRRTMSQVVMELKQVVFGRVTDQDSHRNSERMVVTLNLDIEMVPRARKRWIAFDESTQLGLFPFVLQFGFQHHKVSFAKFINLLRLIFRVLLLSVLSFILLAGWKIKRINNLMKTS